MSYPSTPGPIRFLIVQDYRENPRKCTALPLRGRPGFEFVRLSRPRPREEPHEVPGGLWLDVDAPPFEPADRSFLDGDGRVIVLDASWARVRTLERRLRVKAGSPVCRRSLPEPLRSAYPRKSKLYPDPDRGLATIEAIFAVTLLLGSPLREVLDTYRWTNEFLELNRPVFSRVDREFA